MEELLSVDEAAKILKVSRLTLYKWRGNRKGPNYCRIGNRYYYRKKDLDKYIEGNIVKLNDIIVNE